MKTTLELPDSLMREVKHRAINENRKLKDMVAELLERGLAAEETPPGIVNRVQLPLIRGGQPASPDDFSPDRLAEILNHDEAQWQLEVATGSRR